MLWDGNPSRLWMNLLLFLQWFLGRNLYPLNVHQCRLYSYNMCVIHIYIYITIRSHYIAFCSQYNTIKSHSIPIIYLWNPTKSHQIQFCKSNESCSNLTSASIVPACAKAAPSGAPRETCRLVFGHLSHNGNSEWVCSLHCCRLLERKRIKFRSSCSRFVSMTFPRKG